MVSHLNLRFHYKSEAENLFIYSLTICVYSVDFLFTSSAHICIALYIFLIDLQNYKIYLVILLIVAKVFIPSMTFLF